MAVQRVSPGPVPLPGYSVKDGYLWTMDDPPYSDPVVAHHEAKKETHWFVSASVEYKRYGGGQPMVSGLTADLGEVDAGKNRPSTVEGLSGQGVTARFTYGAWSVSFPEGDSFYYVGGSLSSGSYAFSGGGDFQYDGTLSVTVESREVVLVPAWDEMVAPPATRKISYFGDYAGSGGAAPSNFSAPPPVSGLSPSSLRGEALAYLASGYARLSLAGPDAVWLGEDGRAVCTVRDMFSGGFSGSARLDLFRAAKMGYLFSVRAPAAPAIPFSADSAAVMESGTVEERGTGAYGEWPMRAAPGPFRRGTEYHVAASADEAAERGWLVSEESDSDSDPAGLLMSGFMASASPVQPVPDPGLGLDEAPSADGGPPAPRLLASAVSDMFARPAGDPAAMTRRWVSDSGFAFDQSTGPSFSYYAAAGRDDYLLTDAEAASVWDGLDALLEDHDLIWSDSTEEASHAVSRDDAFWGFAGAVGGAVRTRRAWDTVRVVHNGRTWLVRASADDPDQSYGAWLSPTPGGYPANTESSPSSPWWRYSSAVPGDDYLVAFAGGIPSSDPADLAALPAVPRTSGPLAAGRTVPVSSPDDVAVQPVFRATVLLAEELTGDAASAGAVVSASGVQPHWGGGRSVVRTRSWTVVGTLPGAYGRWTREAGSESGAFDGPTGLVLASPGGMADLVEGRVLPAVGIDPRNLLAGSASWSNEVYPGALSIVAVDKETDRRGVSFPDRRPAYSGDLVTSATLTVHVSLDAAGVFESGYCA